jgi:hypothetical protein
MLCRETTDLCSNFQQRFSDAPACVAYLAAARWPRGFICPAAATARPGGCRPPWIWECTGYGEAHLGHRGHPHVPLQAAADRLILDGLSDGDPLQRHFGPATATSARPGLVQNGLADLRPSCAAAWWRPAAASWPVCQGRRDRDRATAATTIRSPARVGATGRARSWSLASSRCRTAVPARPHPPYGTRFLSRQPARLPRRPSRPRGHRQDRRVTQLCRRRTRRSGDGIGPRHASGRRSDASCTWPSSVRTGAPSPSSAIG